MIRQEEPQLKEIADDLDMGMRSFVHKENGSIVVIPEDTKFPEVDSELWQESMDEIERNASDYLEKKQWTPGLLSK